jgi:hypothetical protein
MIFSRKIKQVNHPPIMIQMNGIPIKRVQNHTHLGVTLSENVKWNTHISIILRKAWQRVTS